MRRATSLLLGLTMLIALAPGLAFAVGVPRTQAVATSDELKAAVADSDVATITLTANIDITEQLTVSRPVAIEGAGKTIRVVADLGKSNDSKHALSLQAGTAGAPIVISDLTIDSNSFAYGVSTYSAAVVELNRVTLKNSKGAGLTVNGSSVKATEFSTSGNAWGAVNVDPGKDVLTPSVFTLESGTLAEANKIWSDNANVTATATVTVNKPAGWVSVPTGTVITAWTMPRTIAVTDAAGLIAAIRGLRACDTIVLADGTYDVKRDLSDLTFGGQSGWYLPIGQPGVTLKGAGSDKTTLTSSVDSANGAWASQDFISVWANGVTIDGVKLLSKAETNKAIEVMGKNFTLKNTRVITNPAGPDLAGSEFYEFSGSVYFNPVVTVTGAAGDVGESRLENVFVESAWISAKETVVTTGTIALKGVTVDWVEGGYAAYDGFGPISANPAVFKVESDVLFVIDETIANLNGQVISRMPKGAILEFKGAKSSWTFDGSRIVTFSSDVVVETTDTTPLRNGIVRLDLDFAHAGDLPGTATAKVFVGKSLAGKSFAKFSTPSIVANPAQLVTVDADGYVALSIDRGDSWYLYEHRVLTVSFETNGGSAVLGQKVVFGELASTPSVAPSKIGYVFAGWRSDAALTDVWDFASTKVFDNTTLYATYTKLAPVTTQPSAKTQASVGNVKTPKTMSRLKTYKITGFLKPAHKSGTYPVRIFRWKRTASGHWKSYGFSKAKAFKHSSYTEYVQRLRLSSSGKWRLRTYAPADATHVASWSKGYHYVTVK